MVQLDISNAELVTLNSYDDIREVTISFTDCPNVVIAVDETDTICISNNKLTIATLGEYKSLYEQRSASA